MSELINWFTAQAQSEIFGGIAAVSLLGYVGYVLRAVPGRAGQMILRQTTVELTVRNDDMMFRTLSRWLSRQKFLGNRRRAKLVSYGRDYSLVPSVGAHWLWYRGRPMMVSVFDNSDNPSDSAVMTIVERITFTTPGRGPEVMSQLVEEARAEEAAAGRVRVLVNGSDYWRFSSEKMPRKIDTVVTADRVGEQMIEDAARFCSMRDWYVSRGVPWRRGYLLCGPPGTGKSSLVFAMASELRMPVYQLALGARVGDGELMTLASEVPEGSVLLMEDVDAFSVDREHEDEEEGERRRNKLSLSALLNAMDGVAAGEGRVTVMTTNYPDRLDAALMRAGRVDMRVDLHYFGVEESVRMWRLFFGDSAHEQRFASRVPASVQPATLQEYLTRHSDDAARAARDVLHLDRNTREVVDFPEGTLEVST